MTRTANVRNKLGTFSDDSFIKIVNESFSYSEILRKIGLTTNGGSSTKSIKQRINLLGLSVEHFKTNGSHRNFKIKICTEEILKENSSYSRRSLKRRLIEESYLKYECSICKIFKWNESDLVLQLDHINGINNDNRLENLRLLCPNCHSQTDTYSGKNK